MKHSFRSVDQPYCERSVWRAVMTFGWSVIFVTGVFAQKITTEFDEAVDFSKFKTFAVRDGRLNSRSPALNSELTKKRIVTEIERALTARGLTPSTERSDLNVSTPSVPSAASRLRLPRRLARLGTRVPECRTPRHTGHRPARPTTVPLVWRGIATKKRSYPAKLSDSWTTWSRVDRKVSARSKGLDTHGDVHVPAHHRQRAPESASHSSRVKQRSRRNLNPWFAKVGPSLLPTLSLGVDSAPARPAEPKPSSLRRVETGAGELPADNCLDSVLAPNRWRFVTPMASPLGTFPLRCLRGLPRSFLHGAQPLALSSSTPT